MSRRARPGTPPPASAPRSARPPGTSATPAHSERGRRVARVPDRALRPRASLHDAVGCARRRRSRARRRPVRPRLRRPRTSAAPPGQARESFRSRQRPGRARADSGVAGAARAARLYRRRRLLPARPPLCRDRLGIREPARTEESVGEVEFQIHAAPFGWKQRRGALEQVDCGSEVVAQRTPRPLAEARSSPAWRASAAVSAPSRAELDPVPMCLLEVVAHDLVGFDAVRLRAAGATRRSARAARPWPPSGARRRPRRE